MIDKLWYYIVDILEIATETIVQVETPKKVESDTVVKKPKNLEIGLGHLSPREELILATYPDRESAIEAIISERKPKNIGLSEEFKNHRPWHQGGNTPEDI